MYVKMSVRRRGDTEYRYLSLVEAVRTGKQVTQRTLLRLGEVSELRDSGQLDRIIAALQAHAGETWLATHELAADGAPGFGAVAGVHTVFGQLGLDTCLTGARKNSATLADSVFVMVANRLISPWSKRRTITEWVDADVQLPAGIQAPSLDQLYRALDAVAELKPRIEQHLYAELITLLGLDLRLCCYDLTSTYFETATGGDERFPSRKFGYSRDKRPDRPQVMIGLLVTGDGIPIAHHVFGGNTNDAATLPSVLADLQGRFGVGKIAVVADRGLISENNLAEVAAAGFDHVLATRLHRDEDVEHVLEQAAKDDTVWVTAAGGRTACEVSHDGRRYVVIDSPARHRRDDIRREQLLARTEDKLIALTTRVRARKLVDPAKIGAAADRILRDSGVSRCFKTSIIAGQFTWAHDQTALDYETRLLAGRYVITTSLTPDQASTAEVVGHYQSLTNVEARFRVLKDFLGLRPVFHWTEDRVKGHIAICVLAAVIEAVIANRLAAANIHDPDLPDQLISARRALAELNRIRVHHLDTGDHHIQVITRRNPLQASICAALGLDTSTWNNARVT
ncbi:MAG: IS1634 family transposase [Actinomycetota bacterium]|nr:IS1634 family transposase [Actinomycetota bacterium]